MLVLFVSLLWVLGIYVLLFCLLIYLYDTFPGFLVSITLRDSLGCYHVFCMFWICLVVCGRFELYLIVCWIAFGVFTVYVVCLDDLLVDGWFSCGSGLVSGLWCSNLKDYMAGLVVML